MTHLVDFLPALGEEEHRNTAREWSVSPSITLERLVNDYIPTSGRRCFPVVEGSRLLGLMTMHDVKVVPRGIWATKTVREAMMPIEKPESVRASEDLYSGLQLMSAEDVNKLPVVENKTVVGMVACDKLLSFIRTRDELGV
jgi:CBS domain-containing protein